MTAPQQSKKIRVVTSDKKVNLIVRYAGIEHLIIDEEIKNVTIYNCYNLKTICIRSKITKLDITNCPKLTEIKSKYEINILRLEASIPYILPKVKMLFLDFCGYHVLPDLPYTEKITIMNAQLLIEFGNIDSLRILNVWSSLSLDLNYSKLDTLEELHTDKSLDKFPYLTKLKLYNEKNTYKYHMEHIIKNSNKTTINKDILTIMTKEYL